MNAFSVVLCACSSELEATTISHALVELQLAACVQILPRMQSIYRWKGKVESASEWLLLIKTSQDLFEMVAAKISELHSYDVPEIVAVPMLAGSASYFAWLGNSLMGGSLER